MATVSSIAEPLAAICTTVPPHGPGVCSVCHGRPNEGFATCWSCGRVMSQVSRPCFLVVPISLSTVHTQVHALLRGYKSKYPSKGAVARVAALIAYFLMRHGACISAVGGTWDRITIVPSSAGRAGPHPLGAALTMVSALRPQYEQVLGPGTDRICHVTASDAGYSPLRPVEGERVLLVDDTFTSGARSQSAASALTLAGATVTAILVAGRVIDPHFSKETNEYWERQRRVPFDWASCCIHG